jgi:hypothetical protein
MKKVAAQWFMIKADNRLTVGNFMFMKGSMEELKLCYILDESQIFDCNRRLCY